MQRDTHGVTPSPSCARLVPRFMLRNMRDEIGYCREIVFGP
ncbi:hypothetical protein [Haladaptatus sp. DYF46]|nr:hypothetical protein [Haladaptatus sp. DYF46]